ncbi:yjeF C-terminal region, hydroxyethylthiazole kinase-related/yjeF N-terminal region [Pedobacter suwonensis]|uniref:Bifunctional NAD(P)H-hydrate repair enzyme n=1 Tax=Pedobacter suwonensis TaxID=332999 RepID=A0A1I0U8W1_9SPHI|nr:NAD(P)H-hydrate dehydratase [Pedobacter suwonensis]SFA60481.1 yjeF C-terminal region, hydroxyethylthiazole kinase-related/yjeF N-terminal region [Pedobacter suwonensis]
MRTLLTSAQMRSADQFTIANKPIASIDLMEKAARAFVQCFLREEFDTSKSVAIFCGKGNNGGDGLAIAHLLLANGYENLKVYIVDFSEKQSGDFAINLQRMEETRCKKTIISQAADLKNLKADIIIDAILGSGLNKPLSGEFEALARTINKLNRKVYAVDVPTGFFAEGKLPKDYNGVKAYKTICFQRPKINFFFPESAMATEKYEVADIDLDEAFIQKQDADFYLLEVSDIEKILQPRKLFSHKGTYGHALIIAGNSHTMGAALLSAMACLHTGAGLTTACIPQGGLTALNTTLPEVMALPRDEYTRIEDPKKYQAIAIGPGLGTDADHEKLLESLLITNLPLIIDADALNILGKRPDLMDKLVTNTVITPHVKEFDRLFGEHDNWWDRVQTAQLRSKKQGIVIVLKNQYTFICLPTGKVLINPTGNPAMAQGGMGDVLTGMITGFKAQGYSAPEAAILACYIHGRAGDNLAEEQFVVAASQLAAKISKEIKTLISK